MYLLIDKFSASKGNKYGSAGDLVTVISESLPAIVVQGDNGNRFSVRFDEIGEVWEEPEKPKKVKPIDLFNQL